jgi:phosphoglycolate phosphatase
VIRLAVFDCDGTLVDSGHSIHLALGETFARHGRPLPPQQESKRVVGLSLTEAMAFLAPDSDPVEHAAMAETYREVFRDLRSRGAVEEPLFDGILPLLDAFEADGWLLAVATGKSDRGLRHCLAAHGLGNRFISLQTADRHPSKPHPAMTLAAMAEAGAEPTQTVVIGDTGWDMGMAKAAETTAIGVLWGYHDEAELRLSGADALATDPGEVLALAAGLIGETVNG